MCVFNLPLAIKCVSTPFPMVLLSPSGALRLGGERSGRRRLVVYTVVRPQMAFSPGSIHCLSA